MQMIREGKIWPSHTMSSVHRLLSLSEEIGETMGIVLVSISVSLVTNILEHF
jgi:hypothetical protein